MPLYNAEKYLAEALQSVLKQTYKDFELICINDASTDNTMKVLQQFQDIDERIKVISNQAHLGAAASRNKGMHIAKGKYITFLDGDDIFEEEMLEVAYKEMEEKNVDVVMYEYQHVLSKDIYRKRSMLRSNKFISQYCKNPFSVLDGEPIELMNWTASPCNKLYKNTFLIENHLEFQTLSAANDVYFVEMVLFLASRIIMLDDRRIMVYAREHTEPTRISFDRDPMCTYKAMKKVEKELIKRDVFPKVYQHFYCRLFYNLRAALLKTKKQDVAEEFYSFLQKEGIRKIYQLDEGKYYQKIESYTYNQLNSFLEVSFSTGWYKYETFFSAYLNKNANKLIDFLGKHNKCREGIIVWGAGENGKVLLNFLLQNNFKILEIVDRDVNKQGKEILGYCIKKPEDVLKKAQVILVSTFFVFKEVLKEVEDKNIEVINIGEVIGKD